MVDLIALDFDDTLTALVAVGAGWAFIMPGLIALTTRFNGYESVQSSQYGVK